MNSQINEKIRKYSYKLQHCNDPNTSSTYRQKLNQYQKMQSGGVDKSVVQVAEERAQVLGEALPVPIAQLQQLNESQQGQLSSYNNALEEVKLGIADLSSVSENIQPKEYTGNLVGIAQEAESAVNDLLEQDKQNTRRIINEYINRITEIQSKVEANETPDLTQAINLLNEMTSPLKQLRDVLRQL